MLTALLTFCTPDYKKVYDKHIGPCIKEFGLDSHSHYTIEKLADWAGITRIKPSIILQELKKGEPILYVDVDARITSREVIDIDALIPPEYIGACYFLDWDKWAGGCSSIIEPLTGTLFFRPSAIKLVEKWLELSHKSTEPDGKTWAKVIEGRKDIYHLGIEWCYINSLPNGNKGNIPCDKPLIIHYQESRNARR